MAKKEEQHKKTVVGGDAGENEKYNTQPRKDYVKPSGKDKSNTAKANTEEE